MANTHEGAMKIAAKKIGISYEDYLAHVNAGEKWCSRCKSWKLRNKFGRDSTRSDKLSASCLQHNRVTQRKSTKGRISPFKGHEHTLEAKREMSLAKQGKQPRLGKKHTFETRLKISQHNRENGPKGEECHSYKDGRLAERRDQRFSREYKRWRYDVFVRDRFTCQECGDNRGGNLRAHHIKLFADHPELRFEVSNGITLCETCHNKKHVKK